MLGLRAQDVPQTISTSYSDDEETGENNFPSVYCDHDAGGGDFSRRVSLVRDWS
jgi:hypothetical protein